MQSPTRPDGIDKGSDVEFPPRGILDRISRFPVPPGQEDQDPTLQPKVLAEKYDEITRNGDTLLTLDGPDPIVIAPA